MTIPNTYLSQLHHGITTRSGQYHLSNFNIADVLMFCLYEEEEEEERRGEERDNLSVAGCGEHEQVCSKIGHQSLTLYSVFSSFFKPVVLSCLWLRRMNKFKTECLSVITKHKI